MDLYDSYKFINYEDSLDMSTKAAIYFATDNAVTNINRNKTDTQIRIELIEHINNAKAQFEARNEELFNAALYGIRFLLPSNVEGIIEIILDLQLIDFLIDIAKEHIESLLYSVYSCLATVLAMNFPSDAYSFINDLMPLIIEQFEAEDKQLRFQAFACFNNLIEQLYDYKDQVLESINFETFIQNAFENGVPFIQVVLLILAQFIRYFKVAPQEEVLVALFNRIFEIGAAPNLYDCLLICLISTLYTNKGIVKSYFEADIYKNLETLLNSIMPDQCFLIIRFVNMSIEIIPNDVTIGDELVRSVIVKLFSIENLVDIYKKTMNPDIRDEILKLAEFNTIYNPECVTKSEICKFYTLLFNQYQETRFSTKSLILYFFLSVVIQSTQFGNEFSESLIDDFLTNGFAVSLVNGLEWGNTSVRDRLIISIWELINRTKMSSIHNLMMRSLCENGLYDSIDEILTEDDLDNQEIGEQILNYIEENIPPPNS